MLDQMHVQSHIHILYIFLTPQSLLGLEDVKASDVGHLTKLSNLTHLELGDCTGVPGDLLQSLSASLERLVHLRVERAPHLATAENLGELRLLRGLQNLELIDVQLKEGFGEGLVKMQALKKLLLIPVYKDEVQTKAEILRDKMNSRFWKTFFVQVP